MSPQEIKVTREMVKAITKGTLYRLLVPFLLFIITVVGTGAFWASWIDTKVKEHEVYKISNEPLKLDMHKAQEGITLSLKHLTLSIDRIEKAQIEHIKDFNDYKDDRR